MKKSSQVPAKLIVAMAAGFMVSGCSSGTTRECRDATGKVIPNTNCTSGRAGARWVTVPRSGGFGSGSSSISS